MRLKPLFFRKQSLRNLYIPITRSCFNTSSFLPNAPSITTSPPPNKHLGLNNPKFLNPIHFSTMALQETSDSSEADSDDGPMTEFLSRFTWIMRGKLSEVYPDCDKQTLNGMLLIIVEKVVAELEKGGIGQMLGAAENTPSQDFSQDLWRTVWEVSISVLEDMKKERKKKEMKKFIHSEEVKEMVRFASDVGIRGDMLRELRFKWAQEKMEEVEFYKSLERIREEARAQEREAGEEEGKKKDEILEEGVVVEGEVQEKSKVLSLPQRRGKIKYKIYGLDLSDPKWREVADRIHEAEKIITPQEAKPVTGKCKLVTEKILNLTTDDDPSALMAEWVELLHPSRIDWLNLLERLRESNAALYYKMAEQILNEESFQANIRDYSKLIDAHAKENRIDDAERILKKMTEKGIQPDVLTSAVLIHMYSKAGNVDCAKHAFEALRSQGFEPDMKVYNSMIMAYVNAGQPKLGESLMREMEARDIKPTKEIYMALLRSFSQRGHVDGAQRIAITMQFGGFQPTLESHTLLVEAFEQAGDPDQARSHFDYMLKLGIKPDDRCTASMISAYEKKNFLDKALNLLLQLEKDGFEPGLATYTVLVDWLCKLKLVNEVETLLGKMTEKGDTPPFKVNLSLCDMYARVGDSKKALRALGIVEGKKEQLGGNDFERLISGLIDGGLVQDAQRMHEMMEACGFAASEPLKVKLMASQSIRRQRPTRSL